MATPEQTIGNQVSYDKSRRDLIRGGLGAAAALFLSTFAGDTHTGLPHLEGFFNIEKASTSELVAAVHTAFSLNGQPGIYFESTSNPYREADVWPHSQVMDMDRRAVLAGLPFAAELHADEENLERYWSVSPPHYPPGYNVQPDASVGAPMAGLWPKEHSGERFVDDNLWIAEHFLREYLATKDRRYLDKVKAVLNIFSRSWEDSAGNGAYWQAQLDGSENKDRVIVSNATAIPLLIAMAKLGEDPGGEYTVLAYHTYGWLRNLQDPETGLYFDKFRGDGSIDKTFYTYCQAKMIDATVAMNAVDPYRFRLVDAQQLFRKSAVHFVDNAKIGEYPMFDAMLVEAGMRLALHPEGALSFSEVRAFANTANWAARNRGTPTELLTAAGIGSLAVLADVAQRSPSEWSRVVDYARIA